MKDQGVSRVGLWVLLGALIVALMPAAALAWTHSGNTTIGGKLGVGTATPARGIHLVGSDAVFRMDRDRYSSAFMLVRTAPGDFNTIWKSFSIGVSASGVNDGGFTISDKDTSAGGAGPARFTIANDGQVEIGSEADPQAGLHVRNPVAGNILRLDDSSGQTSYKFGNSYLLLGNDADFTIAATEQHESDELIIATTGEGIHFVADSDGGTVQADAFTWFNGGSGSSSKRMELVSGNGELRTTGPMSPNHSFDLAEAYWKSEAGIEAGDVVSFDPGQPNAVVLARAAHDCTVVGVVSTDPGLIMGGGAFSAERLEDLWGEEVGALFAKSRMAIEADLSTNDPYIKGRLAHLSKKKAAVPTRGKKADVLRKAVEYSKDQKKLVADMEGAVLDVFCKENLALVALAGRVPVKVDAAYGAIQAGDLLVASATPGHAMRADNPAPQGTVIGKAMESFATGQGAIMMMVLNR